MSRFIINAGSLAVVVAIVNAIINQLRKGEPRLMQAIVTGLAVGITVAAFRYWKEK